MNKQRKTSHILNVFQYDADGHVILPATLTIGENPHSSDNTNKIPSTAWVRTYVSGLSYQGAITLTNTGSSGAATLLSNTLNIPTYTLAGLGGEPAITAGTTSQYWRGDKSFQTLNTTVVTEGTNLYYTDARVGSYLTANNYATQSYVGTQIANLVDAAPGTLDTLNELAAALGDDPNFATTVSTSIGTKVPQARTITINGTSYDLSADRSWTINSMVYPSAGIALSTGTAWGASITDNSANWNTAYGWGNHASAGYLTSYTETDTLSSVTSRGASTSTAVTFSTSATIGRVLIDYDGTDSWFRMQSGNRMRITTTGGTDFIIPNTGNMTYNGNTVWHSGNLTNLNQLSNGPGYITGYTETDTLASVTGRGSSTTTAITISSSTDQLITLNATDSSWTYLGFSWAGTRRGYFGLNASGELNIGSDYGQTFRVSGGGGMTVDGSTVLHGGTNTIPQNITLNTNADNWMWLWQSSSSNSWYIGPSTSNFGIGGNRLAISSSGSSPNSELVIERGTTRLLEVLQANLQYKGNIVWHQGNLTNLSQLTNGPGYLTSLPSHNHDGVYMKTNRTLDTINTIDNGGDRYNPSVNNPTNEHYAVLTYGNGGNVTGQLATHFVSGQLYSRGYNSSWSSWLKYVVENGGTWNINISGSSTYVKHYSGRTDSSSYPVVWAAGDPSHMYSCDAVRITSNTGTLSASNLTASSEVRGNDVYTTGGWFRNHTNSNGIYWSATGWHLMPADAADFRMHSGSSSAAALRMETNGTTRGYVYAENDNTIGFLNNSRNWSFRTYSNGNALVYGYLTVNGGGTSSSIYMNDSDEGQREIHCNSNRIGFLTQSGSWGAYLDDSNNWYADGSMRAPYFYDSQDTGYFFKGNGISRMYGIAIRGDASSVDTSNQIFFWGTGNSTTSAIGFKASGGSFGNPTGFGDGYNTYFTMDTDGRGWVFRRGVGGSDFGSAYTSGWILNNGVWQANGSMRAPIFYDSNNTSYYLDPDSTSRLYATRYDYIGVGQAINTGYRIITNGDYYANGGGNYWAEGRFKQYRGSGTWHDVIDSGNIGSQSVSNADTVGGYYAAQTYTSTGNAAGSFLGGHYSSGGTEKPNSNTFNAGKLKLAMLSNGNLGFGGPWNDVLWLSAYSGGDVKSSHALVFDKYSTNVWVSDQNFDSGSWGTGYLFITSANIGSQSVNYATTASTVTGASTMSGYLTVSANWSTSPYTSALTVIGTYPSITLRNSTADWEFLMHSDSAGDIQYYFGPGYTVNNWTQRYTFGKTGNFEVRTGTITASGDITAYSDIRVKENIEVIENALQKVKSIRGVTFNRTDLENDKDIRHTGVIAQEVLEVLPEVVKTNDKGIYSVAYGNMAGLLIEAIKEQQKQIEELQNKLDNVLSSR